MPEPTYFLCSKPVVEIFKPLEVSKPFKSGWTIDKDDDFFVAVLDRMHADAPSPYDQ